MPKEVTPGEPAGTDAWRLENGQHTLNRRCRVGRGGLRLHHWLAIVLNSALFLNAFLYVAYFIRHNRPQQSAAIPLTRQPISPSTKRRLEELDADMAKFRETVNLLRELQSEREHDAEQKAYSFVQPL